MSANLAMGVFGAIVLLLAVFAALKVERVRSRGLHVGYWSRKCMGWAWKRQFPDASKHEIRAFLDVFVEAFAIGKKQRLKFAPDDKVMDVYHAFYPPGWGMADTLELEHFVLGLEQKYGLPENDRLLQEGTTLGDLFALTHRVPRKT